MIKFESKNGQHIVTVNDTTRVFATLHEALKYIAARY